MDAPEKGSAAVRGDGPNPADSDFTCSRHRIFSGGMVLPERRRQSHALDRLRYAHLHITRCWRIWRITNLYYRILVTQNRKPEAPVKPKRSILHRIGSGIKKLVGKVTRKKSAPSAEAHPEKLHAAAHITRKRAPHAAEEKPRSERRPPPSDKRRESPRREERGARGGPRSGGRDGARGGRNTKGPERERDEDDNKPRTRKNAQPAPPAPPVPEGPYPEAFEVLGFSPAVLAAIKEMGYAQPTEIQVKAAPIVLAGKDLTGASQTGTGKTAAFGMPTLTRLGAPGKLRCLILEPTRELAAQVVEHFEKLGKHTGLRTLLVHGGVGYGKQRDGLETGVDIVVATPGRLLDFMQDGTVSLSDLEVLILDEVDRMLDMGFLPDVRRIVEKTPRSRQTLFFSATMPPQIKGLAEWALKEPESVEIGIRFSPADTVSHYLYPVASDQREELLLELLRRTDFHSVMIFTRTKMDADRLYGSIKRDAEHKVAVMHGDIAQRDREKALQDFRDGTVEVIVATDVAARGLDVSGVTHVINYMVPEHSEDYVHRIGRTGRAKQEGDAFTLFAADELPYVNSIERLIGQTIERRKLDNFAYKFTTVLDNEDRARAIMFGRKKGKKRR
jgi:ATP-dependent RNA helicase RhlE